MKTCEYCNGTRVYREPNDREKFDELVDLEMDKAYYVNYIMAAEKAYKTVGYREVECPYCKKAE